MAGNNGKAGGKSKGLIILIVLVVLVGLFSGWYFLIREAPEEIIPQKMDDGEGSYGYTYAPGAKMELLEMKDVLVNLSGDGGSRYLRLSVVLEYPKDQKKLAEEITEKEHQIKDTLVASLRAKTAEEANKTDVLKDSLLKDINRNLRYGNFAGIYFTDFLVQ